MSYLKIPNLYQDQRVLLFKTLYAMEKIHGTSAHLLWTDETLTFSGGGVADDKFQALFTEELKERFVGLGHAKVCVYGEAYGGKMQAMSHIYGKFLRFVVFEVKIGETWLNVKQAESVAKGLGLEFVHYVQIAANLELIDYERDAPSVQSVRNGVEGPKPREGIILRPMEEVTFSNDARAIAKHKTDAQRETATPRKVVEGSKLAILSQARDIALEWCTERRLEHVLQKFPEDIDIRRTGDVAHAMIDDVILESQGEIVDSVEARKEMGRRGALLFKEWLKKRSNSSL